MTDQVIDLSRPSNWHSPKARVVRCLFCGAVGVWWDCHCEWMQKVNANKLPRPTTKTVDGVLVIMCCPELREAARKVGVLGLVVDTPVSSRRAQSPADAPVTDNPEKMPIAHRAETELDDDTASSVTPTPPPSVPPSTEVSRELRSATLKQGDPPGAADGDTLSGVDGAERYAKSRIACPECGKEFTPIRSTARYCSVACRNKAHRQKHG